MTDAEWAALSILLPAGRGRPPADRRRTLDAIFWVACSNGPWSDLPPELGRADTAHRALRRFAVAGLLDRLLVAASRHPLASPGMRSLEWRVARAFRRACRLLSVASLALARSLGLIAALPCSIGHLPHPELEPLLLRTVRHLFAGGQVPPVPELRWLMRLHRIIAGRPWHFRTTGAAW
jgi:transposase